MNHFEDESFLPEENVDFNDPPKMVWISVNQAYELLWPENPKEHDLGAIAESIELNGFQELPKYDATLGGIKAGNGRIEALYLMEREGKPLPRGLGTDKQTGDWVMPILIGVDAASVNLARLYAIDSNNLSLQGGTGLTAIDASRMYDTEKYLSLIKELAEEDALPVSIDEEDAALLLEKLLKEDTEEKEQFLENSYTIKIKLNEEQMSIWTRLKKEKRINSDTDLVLSFLR